MGQVDSFTFAQGMARGICPDLTGDELDRVGNLIADQAPTENDVTGPMLMRAINQVKSTRMEK